MSCRYESRLAGEREASIRLQGENGIMRSKFTGLTAQINQLQADLSTVNSRRQDADQVLPSASISL